MPGQVRPGAGAKPGKPGPVPTSPARLYEELGYIRFTVELLHSGSRSLGFGPEKNPDIEGNMFSNSDVCDVTSLSKFHYFIYSLFFFGPKI